MGHGVKVEAWVGSGVKEEQLKQMVELLWEDVLVDHAYCLWWPLVYQ